MNINVFARDHITPVMKHKSLPMMFFSFFVETSKNFCFIKTSWNRIHS